ncbi:MAG: hypothetical protein ABWY68_08715 [Cryobacterium sp.]
MTQPLSRRLVLPGLLAATVLATLLTGTALALPGATTPAAAAGAASVTIANGSGEASADPEFATTLTVTGSGFQSIQGGFGGIYALFGWVDSGSWQPSAGGQVGSDYRYVPDQESKDNAGFQRFISFPGSETEAAANAVMSATGDWSLDMVVPGAVFESQDRSGAVSEVDCLEVQCGIITIGAHGVKNANNETFTPIAFVAPAAEAAAAAPAAGASAGTSAGAARVGYTTTTATAGNVLSFTGQGFAAGEQVVATLDDGVAAVGPLTAGPSGEVAGVLQLPADLRAGTHLLSLNGAASAAVAQTEVAVAANPGLASAPVAEEAPPVWPYLVLGISVLLALVLLLTSLITALVRAGRRRRARRALAAEATAEAAAASAGTARLPTFSESRTERIVMTSPEVSS